MKIYHNLNFSIVKKSCFVQKTKIKSLPDTGKSCIIRIHNTVKKENSQVKMYNTIQLLMIDPVKHY